MILQYYFYDVYYGADMIWIYEGAWWNLFLFTNLHSYCISDRDILELDISYTYIQDPMNNI